MTVDIQWSTTLSQALKALIKNKAYSDQMRELATELVRLSPGAVLTLDQLEMVHKLRGLLVPTTIHTEYFEAGWIKAYSLAHGTRSDTPSPQVRQMGFTSKSAFDYTIALAAIAKSQSYARDLRSNLSDEALAESTQISQRYLMLTQAFSDIIYLAEIRRQTYLERLEIGLVTSQNKMLLDAFLDGLSGEHRLRSLIAHGPNVEAQFVKFNEGRTARTTLLAISAFVKQTADSPKCVQNYHELLMALMKPDGNFEVDSDNLENIIFTEQTKAPIGSLRETT